MVLRVIFSREKSQIFVNEESLENPTVRHGVCSVATVPVSLSYLKLILSGGFYSLLITCFCANFDK